VVNAGTAMLFMKGGKDDLNLRGAYLHLAYDALISVGVVIAAAIIYFTGLLWIDPLVGLLIVAVILAGTWGLLKDSVNLILDAVPANIEIQNVKEYLLNIDGVTDSDESYAAIGRDMKQQFSIHHVTLQVEKDPDCTNNDCD
jgi:cobalt-zinc-cadmium efflux system protein